MCMITTTASQSVSVRIPKNPGSFDPNNEDDESEICHVIAETYNSRIGADDKMTTTKETGVE